MGFCYDTSVEVLWYKCRGAVGNGLGEKGRGITVSGVGAVVDGSVRGI